MKQVLVLGMVLCPLFCCAMQNDKDLKKRKVEHSLHEPKKQKQDLKAEGIMAGFKAINEYKTEQEVFKFCDIFSEKVTLEELDPEELTLTVAKKVLVTSYNRKIFEEFDLDSISRLSTYFACLKNFKDMSALHSHDPYTGKELKLNTGITGGIYTFEEDTSEAVIKCCIAYFKNPESLPEIKQDILRFPLQALVMLHNAQRLGIEPLETFVSENILELALKDKNVQDHIFKCKDIEGNVDEQQLKKVFIDACGGHRNLFEALFDKYYHKNPKYWDMKHPLKEIKIESGKPVNKVTISRTGKYVTAEIRHDCLLVYKNDNGTFKLDTTIKLLRHDMKGGSGTNITFSPDDSLCAVYQKRGLHEQLYVYDCCNWRILDAFTSERASLDTFEGFTNDNLLIFTHNTNFDDVKLCDAFKKKYSTRSRIELKNPAKTIELEIESEILLTSKKYIEALKNYEEPCSFKLKRVDSHGHYALVSFTSTTPDTNGSGIMFSTLIFDCEKHEVVKVFSSGSSMEFQLDESWCAQPKHVQRILFLRDEESKICFYGTTLQGIVEKTLGEDFFKPLQSTSFFSFSRK